MEKQQKQYAESSIFEIEDILHAKYVFVNGLDDRHASMMAYMTCIDYNALKECLNEIFQDYSLETWQKCCEYWEYMGYLSPIPVLLAREIARYGKFETTK